MGRTSQQVRIGPADLPSGPFGETAEQNEKLLRATLAISRCATLEQSLKPLLDAALDITRMDGGGVYRVQGEVAVLRHHRGLPAAFIRKVVSMSLTPPPVQVLLHQQEPVELAEISAVMRELFARHGIRHAFSFPLRAGETVFGFLNVGSTRTEEPARADLLALQLLVGQMEALFCRLHQQTALRESEELFRAFMNNSPAIAWMRDAQGRYVYLSRTYESRSGWRLEDCRGKTVFDLWPREIAEVFWKNDQEVLRTGRVLEVIEETPAPDGGRCYWWNFKFPFADASGRRFVGGIGVDITERRHLEEELRQFNERLEKQVQTRTEELEHRTAQLQRLTRELVEAEQRERRRLAAFLHDDLQQVLAAAKFQLSVLIAQLPGQDETRGTVQYAKQMLQEAIEKTRSLSHELGPTALFRGDLGESFEWLAGQMESRHGLAVQVDVRGRVACHCESVRSFFYRAAQELLFNVAKHARVREAKVRLRRVRDQLRLTVSDEGCGFDPASLDKTGGYGLMSVRERAELLGGHMTIKSTPGRGSIFFLVVPDTDP
jgi:PAS domain S-box-containing protein